MAKAKASAPTSNAPYTPPAQASGEKIRAERNARHLARCAAKTLKVARGTARANRREAAKKSGLQGANFPEIWNEFRKLEKPKTIAA